VNGAGPRSRGCHIPVLDSVDHPAECPIAERAPIARRVRGSIGRPPCAGRTRIARVLPREASVFICGGGPFGLMLANELGRRRISVVLVDQKRGTTENVQANATQARTMEHYQRLGFADEVRALGLPPDFPTDIAYFTRFARHELARFSLPSARDAKQLVRTLSGSWSVFIRDRINERLGVVVPPIPYRVTLHT
jgi:hypothetical protein